MQSEASIAQLRKKNNDQINDLNDQLDNAQKQKSKYVRRRSDSLLSSAWNSAADLLFSTQPERLYSFVWWTGSLFTTVGFFSRRVEKERNSLKSELDDLSSQIDHMSKTKV